MNIAERLNNAVRQILDTDAKNIVLAYSGGVDSHVLLHLVSGLRDEFPQHTYLAVHIHHGLSPKADDWLSHCEAICNDISIPFERVKVKIDLAMNEGIEAAARAARYDALHRIAPDNSMILLGQHADDQLETFLLQLKRGAGPKGLSSMPVTTSMDQTMLVRPFLSAEKPAIGRREIEQYAELNDLNWIEDESNLDTRFDRNFLRQQVLPLLTQRWPELSSAVSRSAKLCAQQQQLLDEVTETKLVDVMDDDKRLHIAKLNKCTVLWQKQIIRYWLDSMQASMPTEAVLGEIQAVLRAREDATPVVQWQRWQVRRFQDYLYCLTDFESAKPENLIIKPSVQQQLPLTNQWVCVAESENSNASSLFEIRFGGFATRFKPQGESMTKPIKQWFKRWNIEPWHRQHIPLLYIDDELVAIILKNNIVLAEKGSEEANQTLKNMVKIGNLMPL